jgi:Rod binding domain-containing protein
MMEEVIRTSGLMQRAAIARSPEEKQQIKEEFLAIFYKEMLKQSIKPPNFSGEENKNSVGAAFTADILLEQMAIKLSESAQLGESILE